MFSKGEILSHNLGMGGTCVFNRYVPYSEREEPGLDCTITWLDKDGLPHGLWMAAKFMWHMHGRHMLTEVTR